MEDINVSNNLYKAVNDDIAALPSYDYITITPESIKIANEWNRNHNIHPVIIPTFDENELTAQWDAWQTLSVKKKIISNSKAIEIFGISNTDIFNYCSSRLYKKEKEDSLTMPEIPISKAETDLEMEALKTQEIGISESIDDSIRKVIINNINPDLLNKRHYTRDYFSISHLTVEPKGLTEASTEDERYNMQYDACRMGFCSYDFYNQTAKNINRFHEMHYAYYDKTDPDSREALAEEASMIGYDIKSSLVRGHPCDPRIRYKLPDGVSIIDVSEMTCDYISESTKETDIKPVFLIQLYSGKWYSKIIKDFTHGKFSHAAISLDPDFKRLYTFTRDGFTIESIDTWRTELTESSFLSIHCLFITEKDYQTLTQKLEWYLKNVKDTGYAWGRLLAIMLNKPGVSNNKLVCSQFVDLIFKSIGVDLTGKDSSLVTPNDFITTDINIYKLYDNDLSKFDNKTIKTLKNKVNVLCGSVECDYKTATVRSTPIRTLLATEQMDLSLLRACKPLFTNMNVSYVRLLPYLETYVADFDLLKKRQAFNLEYDGSKLKNLFTSEE